MGCCSSKIPSFPSPSTANDIAPTTIPQEFQSSSLSSIELIKFIPQPGAFGNAIAVYISNAATSSIGTTTSNEQPSYFFQPVGGCYKLFKPMSVGSSNNNGGKEEVAKIKGGWQTSTKETVNDTSGELMMNTMINDAQQQYPTDDVREKTTHAEKTITIHTTKPGGNGNKIEEEDKNKVTIDKTYHFDSSSSFVGGNVGGMGITISNGYTIRYNEEKVHMELSYNGTLIACIYDKVQSTLFSSLTDGSSTNDTTETYEDLSYRRKEPIACYLDRTFLSSSLSSTTEDQLVTALSIIASTSHRLIPVACLDIQSGRYDGTTQDSGYYDNSGGTYYHNNQGYNNNNNNENRYDNENNYDDDGGDDGWDDDGGGGGDE